ncbi:MAG TPA: 16S rRNA (adenine(1518)-N(6)/adenine(1519)-N(6))-dimethyltransferase RsmA [Cyclobacteriaceae bacterium]|nr:16S rRNA (adenine(1518)-N(6)/adenine(1519)-N(6))-dimethyltransferase RsmA [Cyclobacteriaceae bacterium]
MVRPKKYLGQHFLKDQHISAKIVEALDISGQAKNNVLEIGPGTGVLTKILITKPGINLKLIEIDTESVAYLQNNYAALSKNIIEADFLDLPLESYFNEPFSIIGNFPYNISSQIFFKILSNVDMVEQVVCMLQKEVAQRIASAEGNKDYGILSVLLQARYDIKYLFSVLPGVFQPPPKVNSGVISLVRKPVYKLACNEALFTKVVKQAFQMRRKTLRNALKGLNLPPAFYAMPLLDKRAEQLSVEQFIELTKNMEEGAGTNSI